MSLDTPTPMGTDTVSSTTARSMTVRWNDDRQRWSNQRILDLGTTGDMFPTLRLHQLGHYRTRQWEIVCTADVVQCVVMVEEEAELLR